MFIKVPIVSTDPESGAITESTREYNIEIDGIQSSDITDATVAGKAMLTAGSAEEQANLVAPYISGGGGVQNPVTQDLTFAPGNGIVLQAANGDLYKISVSNAGALITTLLNP